ncbi:MAG: hypothetical protein K2N90_13705 [Lachnospiraceae bacterium]|nr:hypothetical protein [Lachnospiraceae bacterium]
MEKSEFTEKQKLLAKRLEEAQAVLVGIGEEFNEGFEDIGKFPELMSALEEVDTNPTLEWTVPFLENCYIKRHNEGRIVKAYKALYELIKDKDYFIVTTCIDGNIEKADFDKERIVEPCGSYKALQCSKKCNGDLISSEGFTSFVCQAILDGVGLDSLERPVCRFCGEPLAFNNILCESNYMEEGYKPQWEKYTNWLQHTLHKKVCILELGVGMNLPEVIRWPFEKVAFYNEKASFFRVNEQLYHMTKELEDKGTSVMASAIDFLNGYIG